MAPCHIAWSIIVFTVKFLHLLRCFIIPPHPISSLSWNTWCTRGFPQWHWFLQIRHKVWCPQTYWVWWKAFSLRIYQDVESGRVNSRSGVPCEIATDLHSQEGPALWLTNSSFCDFSFSHNAGFFQSSWVSSTLIYNLICNPTVWAFSKAWTRTFLDAFHGKRCFGVFLK